MIVEPIDGTTPAAYCKQYGVTFKQVIETTKAKPATFKRWHSTKPMLFIALVIGTKTILETK